MADCIFCRILAGELPASFVHRDEHVAAFMDIQPVNPGHLLVVPIHHAAHLADIDGEMAARLMHVGHRMAAALRASDVRCEGVNLFLADGKAAMQEVFHVHLHVFPRFTGDGFGLRFPPGYHTRLPARDELDRVAAALRRTPILSSAGETDAGEQARRDTSMQGVSMSPTSTNGKICYLELPTTDVARSADFYSKVFGWTTRRRGDGSTAFDDTTGEVSGAWVVGRPPASTPGLLFYVMVDSVPAAVDAVVANGGEIVQPVGADAPEITARFRDPGGNVIGLYQEPAKQPPH